MTTGVKIMQIIGPKKFRHAYKGHVEVGDQFVSVVWKGFTYVVANSSKVTTEDVSVHAGGYMTVVYSSSFSSYAFLYVLNVLARLGSSLVTSLILLYTNMRNTDDTHGLEGRIGWSWSTCL